MRKDYWPKDLSYIDWTGIKNLKEENTPFQGDISSYDISWSNLKGVDVGKVTKWPTNLSGINWEGVIGLISTHTPFKQDLDSMDIYGSIFKGVDVSQVTKWPTDLSGINWEGVIGLTSANTPFQGDISSYSIGVKIQKKIIDSHMILLAKRFTSLKGIDISLVTEWPKKFAGINWKETIGSENKPNANNRNNKNDVDIQLIQDILNAKDADAKIVLSSNTRGNIIANNEQKILKKLRKMITGDETGAANHDSMKGVAISISVGTDSPITTTAQEIIVTLRKGDGTPITISKFQVKREFTTTGVK